MEPEVEVETYGPIFTGAIYGQMKACLEEIDEALADETVDRIQGWDVRTFKNPTGYARSKVRAHRTSGRVVVDRSHIAYGPWLEDGGSRSGIFSGYHAFEKAKREVQDRVTDIADPIVEERLIQA